MKIINKYITFSLLKIIFFSILLTSLLLLSVDLFSNFDSYVQNNVTWIDIVKITLLYFPQAIIIVFPPATLFSITFFLSQMYTNNEIIALLSSGISIKSIYKVIFMIIIIISSLLFIFNENVIINSKIEYENYKNDVFNINTNFDNSNIGLIDSYNKNIIYANRYVEKDKTLYDVVVVQKDDNNNIIERIDAKNAIWNSSQNLWTLNDVTITNINDEIEIKNVSKYENDKINLDVNMFRSLNSDLKTMYLPSAIKYLRIQKDVNLRLWYENMSDFLDRILEPFSIIIMTIIACSIDYKGRKNVFLFSVFNSIVLAVIYYVSKMIFQILSKQSFINPYFASILPYIIILLSAFTLNKLKKLSVIYK